TRLSVATMTGVRGSLPPPREHGQERVIEHMIGNPAALRNSFALVERPVNPQIDPALSVLLLGLRQGLEMPRRQRPDDSLPVEGHAVELVGNESEANIVSTVEAAQH